MKKYQIEQHQNHFTIINSQHVADKEPHYIARCWKAEIAKKITDALNRDEALPKRRARRAKKV